MSSTCFEPEGSCSRRRLCIQLWYSTFYMHQYKQSSPIIWPHFNTVNRCSLAYKNISFQSCSCVTLSNSICHNLYCSWRYICTYCSWWQFFSLFLAVSVVPQIYMFMDKNVVSFFCKFVSWFDYCRSKIDYLMSW